MKFITAHAGRLVELSDWQQSAARRLKTGLRQLDDLYGAAGLIRGAVHELLHPARAARPMFPAMLLAKSALVPEPAVPVSGVSLASLPSLKSNPPDLHSAGVIVISDPRQQLYPPAAAQLGIPLSRLYLLHPRNHQEELWAIGECLASAGVSVVVASLGSLTQVEARRLQLAAERGGTVGLIIRPTGKTSEIYASVTRTLITPAPATATSQRWNLQVIHGQGCQVGKGITLEYNREEHFMHTTSQLEHHKTVAPAKARACATA